MEHSIPSRNPAWTMTLSPTYSLAPMQPCRKSRRLQFAHWHFSVHKCIRCYQDRHFQGSLLSNFSGQILRGDHKRYVLEKPTHACLLLLSTLLSFQQKNCIIQFMYNDTQIRLVKVVAHPGSTLNIDLILWHTQLIVYKVKC